MTSDITVTDRTIPGPHGPIPLRAYRAAFGDPAAPGLVWVHGGAFMGGDLDMPEADWVSRQLAERGVPVVSVDYRLAPMLEMPPRADGAGNDFPPPHEGERVRFPVAGEEVTASFLWVHEHAAELGIEASALSIGGASAGANLAAGASMRLRDAGEVQPRSVLLAYPLVHARLPEPRPELADKISALPAEAAFPPEAVLAINVNYVRDEARLADAYAFPGGHDLQGLPPTFILNSDHDSLRSSGEAYASELAAAGVDVLQLREDGTRHGHLNEPDNPAAHASIERMTAWLLSNPLVGRQHTDSVPTTEQKALS